MEKTILIADRPVRLNMSNAASEALGVSTQHLIVEMELYFSCLIRKQVRFHYGAPDEMAIRVSDQLSIQFRPVMTEHCKKDYVGDEPPLTNFPIKDVVPFVPKWLKLDYRRGKWFGEFGY